jgi:hypothetical protein
MTATVRLEPTTKADCEQFFRKPLPYRIRALTAKKGDEILGIGGIAFMPDGRTGAFLDATEEAIKRHPITLHKAALRTLAMAREMGVSSLSTWCDRRRGAADRYLTRLGFSHTGIRRGFEEWTWAQ